MQSGFCSARSGGGAHATSYPGNRNKPKATLKNHIYINRVSRSIKSSLQVSTPFFLAFPSLPFPQILKKSKSCLPSDFQHRSQSDGVNSATATMSSGTQTYTPSTVLNPVTPQNTSLFTPVSLCHSPVIRLQLHLFSIVFREEHLQFTLKTRKHRVS